MHIYIPNRWTFTTLNLQSQGTSYVQNPRHSPPCRPSLVQKQALWRTSPQLVSSIGWLFSGSIITHWALSICICCPPPNNTMCLRYKKTHLTISYIFNTNNRSPTIATPQRFGKTSGCAKMSKVSSKPLSSTCQVRWRRSYSFPNRFTPPESNIDTKNEGFLNVSPASNMAINGEYPY